jgi:hypothetical protein
VYSPRQVFGYFEFAFDERLVDDHFRGDIREFTSLPRLDPLAHGFEIPLHSVDAYGNATDQRKRLLVLGEHRRKRAGYNVSRFGSSEYSISKKPIYGPLGPTSFNFRVARDPYPIGLVDSFSGGSA